MSAHSSHDDHPAKVETTFATRIVAQTENAEHMIRKTIYACRMDPMKPAAMVSLASTPQDVQLSNPFPLHNDKQHRHPSLPKGTKQDFPGSGGARRDRTDDLKLAKLPLSQLSYGPVLVSLKRRRRRPPSWLARHWARRPVGLASPRARKNQLEEPDRWRGAR